MNCEHSNCEHLSCEHLSCEYLSCEHLSFKHLSCAHLSFEHLSGECLRGEHWICKHLSCEHLSCEHVGLLAHSAVAKAGNCAELQHYAKLHKTFPTSGWVGGGKRWEEANLSQLAGNWLILAISKIIGKG